MKRLALIQDIDVARYTLTIIHKPVILKVDIFV